MSCSHSKLIIPSIVDATRSSSWSRLVRAIANVLRFTGKMVAKVRKLDQRSGQLLQKLDAERKLFRQAQWEGNVNVGKKSTIISETTKIDRQWKFDKILLAIPRRIWNFTCQRPHRFSNCSQYGRQSTSHSTTE